MAVVKLTVNALLKVETEYNGKFGYNIGQIQHIAIMSRIDICCISCFLGTQNMAPNLPSLQDLKCRIQYLARHPHTPIF